MRVLLVTATCAATLSGSAASATTPDLAGSEPSPLFLIDDGRVPESSGIALSRRHRLMWVHNDAGNEPAIYGIRPTGATQVRITVAGAAGEDWEDIAVATVGGRDWIYLDDIGDAYQVRKASGLTYRRQFEIVRLPEPDAIDRNTDLRVTAEVFPVEFEHLEGVNVEAMAVAESGAIILVEKIEPDAGANEQAARVWRIAQPVRDRPNVPVEVARIPVVGASGADISMDGTTMALRDARSALVYDLRRGLDGAFDTPVRELALPEQDQGEGVAFTLDDQGLVLAGEGRAASVWFVPLTAGAVPMFGPLPATTDAPAGGAPGRERATSSTQVWNAWLSSSLLIVIGALMLAGPMTWRRRSARRGR